ncbi:unnamed protein product [Clonostachys byssicola]|uniref:Uncharacterized protein n=1 Tax=Clonostachys byssicola TaxID=160290 RepID=A0A9N9UN93_9HYPO|nr:unnamed protein product [Clonostachys byssicola]
MALWKEADLEIAARGEVIQYESPQYDLENLFTYKVCVEPASGSSSAFTPEPNQSLAPGQPSSQVNKQDTQATSPVPKLQSSSQYSPGKVSVSSISHRLANRPPDEALVNKAVVDLLQGISRKHPLIRDKYDWSIIHQTFYVFQQREAKEKIMTSRTDGCLQVVKEGELLEDCRTLAIVEALHN